MNESRTTTKRGGMTLMEIMFAIVILSIGLLGVLAAIPFGAMQMGRMVEKDFVNNLGESALSTIHASGWDNPRTWMTSAESGTGGGIHPVPLISDNEAADFRQPCMIDPLGFLDLATDAEVDERFLYLWSPSTEPLNVSSNNVMRFVFPEDVYNNDLLLDTRFRSMDDVIYKKESGNTDRPIMLTDTSTGDAQFKGEYSWMAMMTPIAVDSSQGADAMTFPPVSTADTDGDSGAVVDMQTDVVVFRGRAVTDELESLVNVRDVDSGREFTVKGDYMMAMAKLKRGDSGYAGGTFRLMPRAYLSASAKKPTVSAQRAFNSEMIKALKSSTHVLLIGPDDDFSAASFENDAHYVYPRLCARWVKIASFGQARGVANPRDPEPNTVIEVTVIGENCPVCWSYGNDGAKRVRMIVYPNVRGVFTRTTRVGGVP